MKWVEWAQLTIIGLSLAMAVQVASAMPNAKEITQIIKELGK